MQEGKPIIDFAWILDHLDDIAEAHGPAPPADRSSRSLIGFVLSLGLAVWAIRRPRVYGPMTAIGRHPVHDPEPRRLRPPATDLRALAA